MSLTKEEIALAKERRLEAQNLQIIEDNPLTEDEIAMFEMFEREGWSHDRRRAYIIDQMKAELREQEVVPAE